MSDNSKRKSTTFKEEIVKIDKLDSHGNGLGRLANGQVFFVSGALPKETARVQFRESGASYVNGNLLEILETSDKRIEARCPYFGKCSLCQLQNLSYPDQLSEKKRILCDQLTRIGKLSDAETLVLSPLASPTIYDYRCQMRFIVLSNGNFALPGKDRKPLPIDHCPICHPAINQLLTQITFEDESGIQTAEIRTDRDGAPQLILRGDSDKPETETETDLPVSIVYSSPAGSYVMSGDSTLVQEFAGIEIAASEDAFFFANPAIIELVCQEIEKIVQIDPQLTVLNLNCRTGFWSKWAAKKINQLIAVDKNEENLEDFLLNLNDFDNVSIYLGDANQILPNLPEKIDLVIADGDSEGLSVAEIQAIAATAAQTVIFLCKDGSAFSRDLARFSNGPYQIKTIVPYDEMPQTAALSALAILEKKRTKKHG